MLVGQGYLNSEGIFEWLLIVDVLSRQMHNFSRKKSGQVCTIGGSHQIHLCNSVVSWSIGRVDVFCPGAERQSMTPGRDIESICTFFCLTGINKLLVYFMYILEVCVFGLAICNARRYMLFLSGMKAKHQLWRHCG